MNRQVFFIDTTLRDGEQAPGVFFSSREKCRIASLLDEIGVSIIEAGIPAAGKEERQAIEKILSLDLKAEIITWNRMKKEDIDASSSCGANRIHISVPVSDIQIQAKFGKTREWLFNELEKTVSYAIKKKCLIVSLGAEDASRADQDFLLLFAEKLKEMKIGRIRYADTVGILTPALTFSKIMTLKQSSNLEIDFHGHNDFGMATANSFSAYEAGANFISTTVNGLGERAGNAALEEVVMAIEQLGGIKTGINKKLFTQISALVEKFSNKKNALNKPIVGKEVFYHESGIHVDGLIKNPETYLPFNPKELGRKNVFVLGKSSGKKSIMKYFENKGVFMKEEQALLIKKKMGEMKKETMKLYLYELSKLVQKMKRNKLA